MTVVANDTFTDTSGTVLSSHTADSGGPWTKRASSSDAQIDNANAMRNKFTGPAIWTLAGVPAAGSADYDVYGTVKALSAAGQGGLIGRCDTAGTTFYLANFSTAGNTVILYKVVSGGFTQLGSTATQTINTNDVVMLRMRGTSISVRINGVDVVPAQTDSAITAQGFGGVRWDSDAADATGLHLDSITVDDGQAAGASGNTNLLLMGVG